MAARERSRNVFGGSGETDDGNSPLSSSSSLVNESEAYAVMMHVAGLLGAGVAPADIAVQSPYAAQVRLIRSKLAEVAARGAAPGADLVEVASVDSFQGREAEAVVISTVRSNDRGSVGFLADVRRANVAVTRARRHVCIVGDSSTVGCDPFLSRLVSHVRNNGVVATANEFGELHQDIAASE
jgi:superfamily I DNA and/or RNA helicase